MINCAPRSPASSRSTGRRPKSAGGYGGAGHKRHSWHLCHETIYEAVYCGLVVPTNRHTLRTGRTYRHKRSRGRHPGGRSQAVDKHEVDPRPARL